MWKFTLNNNLIEDPIGWNDATIEVERLEDIKGLLYSYITDLTFHGYGYTLLLNEFNNNNYCTPVEVLIEQFCDEEDGYTTFFEGYIYLTECIFDLEQCLVDATVVDRTYIGKIEANRKIKATVTAGRSKNDVTITPVSPIDITFFTPCTGVDIGTDVKCFSVYDCFEFLVAFMTDNTMQFGSTLFGAGGDLEGWMITTGNGLINPGEEHAPRITFKDLFEEMDKKTNISFYIDESGVTPTLYVERTEDIYEASTVTTLDRVRNIKAEVDTRNIFSTITLGSNNTEDEGDGCGGPGPGFAYPDGAFFGHKEESYHMLGECNIDNELNLVSGWIIDSNVIEDLIVNGNDDNKKEIVIVETNYPGASTATKGTLFGATVRTYNPGLTNQNTLLNYLGAIPFSVAAYLAAIQDEFRAEFLGPLSPPLATPAPFGDEITDPGANYDNAAYHYRASFLDGGTYLFQVVTEIDVVWGAESEAGDLDITVNIEVDRGSGYNVEFSETQTLLWYSTKFSTVRNTYTTSLYLDVADRVRVASIVFFSTGPGPGTNVVNVHKGSSFECLQAPEGGGLYETFEPENVRLVLYEFEYPLSNIDFNTLLSGNRQKIAINDGRDLSDVGWLDRLTYDVQKGTGQWTIRAKNDISPQ